MSVRLFHLNILPDFEKLSQKILSRTVYRLKLLKVLINPEDSMQRWELKMRPKNKIDNLMKFELITFSARGQLGFSFKTAKKRVSLII